MNPEIEVGGAKIQRQMNAFLSDTFATKLMTAKGDLTKNGDVICILVI